MKIRRRKAALESGLPRHDCERGNDEGADWLVSAEYTVHNEVWFGELFS